MAQYTAGDVMDLAASLLNDSGKSLFTYDVQLPYLKMADDDLGIELLSNEAAELDQVCDINVNAGSVLLSLPCNFFLPIKLEERAQTSTNDDDFIDMEEKSFEPSIQQSETLRYWSFRNNKVNFIGATVNQTVRLKFKRTLSSVTDFSVVEEVAKAKNFLAARTAALVSEFVGSNKVRADSLNAQAIIYLEKLTSVLVKNNQGNRIRRKPFRVPYYRRVG